MSDLDRNQDEAGGDASPRSDGLFGRAVALLVLLGVIASLAWLHGGALFSSDPAEEAGLDANDPLIRCIAERSADIDQMLADGTINDGQAGLFKQRAEALCQAQEGGGSPVPQ